MEDKETGRLEAFSDGVFAVAITLLILNIQPPHDFPLDDLTLLSKLLDQWPNYLAFVASFATIGVMWVNHHRLFTHIKHTDNALLGLNLLLLLVIVFIPFPTALLAQYAVYPDKHVAALLYTGTSVIMAICFYLLWRYASYHNRLLDKKADPHAVKAITNQYRFGPLVYLIVFAVAWFSAPVSIALILLLALYFALPSRRPRPQPENEPRLED